jgi:cytochrome c biogenesis factor
MAALDAPERPRPAPAPRRRPSRGLKVWAAIFGVIFGAYVSQKLKGPLGFDADDGSLLFWAFFLSVMTLLAAAFMACALLARSVRQR